jgi:hypothetical protein
MGVSTVAIGLELHQGVGPVEAADRENGPHDSPDGRILDEVGLVVEPETRYNCVKS